MSAAGWTNGGAVPEGGNDGDVLTSDGSGGVAWEAIPAGLAGSTGGTDNAVLRADGTGGSTVQASSVTISDAGGITAAAASTILSLLLGAAVDETWATTVAVTTPIATCSVDGTYVIAGAHHIARTSGGSGNRAGIFVIVAARTAGTLSVTVSYEAGAGGYAPTVAYSVDGDNIILTITSTGSGGTVRWGALRWRTS